MAVAVKELLENAIDAKATCVTIRFVDFGVEKIEVSDNGTGISPENLPLVCRRHYTSKLDSYDDLDHVSTFGFRGEALASLSNICDLNISTRDAESDLGTEFTVDQSGEIRGQARQLAKTVGTTVTLRHLFKPLPVRRKELQKNHKKAFQQALHLIHQYAIGILGLRIACFRKQQHAGVEMNLFTSQGLSIQANIIEVFDYRQFTNLIPFPNDLENLELETKLTPREHEKLVSSGFALEGFISKPDSSCGKSSKDYHFIYLNNRPVDMPDISKNINRIYRLFNRSQYPFLVLKVSLDEQLIDRNLTPDKRSVLLAEDHVVYKVIQLVLDSMFCRSETDLHSLSSSQIMNTFLDTSIENSQKRCFPNNSFDSLNSSVDSNSDRFPIPRKIFRTEDFNSVVDIPKVSLNQQREEEEQDSEANVANCGDESLVNVSLISSIHAEDDETAGGLNNDSHSSSREYLNDSLPDGQEVGRPSDSDNGGLNSESRQTFQQPFKSPIMRPYIDPTIENFNKQNVQNIVTNGRNPMVQTSLRNHPFFGSMNLPVKTFQAPDPPPPSAPQQQQSTEYSEEPGCSRQEYSGPDLREEYSTEQPRQGFQTAFNVMQDAHELPTDLDIDFSSMLDERPESYVIEEPSQVERPVFEIDVSMDQIEEEYEALFESSSSASQSADSQPFTAGIDPEENDDALQELKMRFSKMDFDGLEVIGQFNLGFIIARKNSNLFIIDQHAVDERTNFEALLANPKMSTQNLVCHMQLSMSGLNEMIAMENFPTFEKLGFKFSINDEERVGKRLKLTQIPLGKEWIGGSDDVEEVIAAIRNSPTGRILSDDIGNFILSGLRREIAYSACRMSVKIGEFLNETQMKNILRGMSALRNPFHCAHGRPTLRHLSRIPDSC